MSNTRNPANLLDTLPLELISLIFDNIGYDLVAHVTFSKLRPYIYDCCYRNRGPTFWQPVLRASGIGRLEDKDELAEDDAWERLAFECVEHATTCLHPECGMVLLRSNEMSVIDAINEAGISLMDTVDPDEDELVPGVDTVEPHDVYRNITFKKRKPYFENWPGKETWQTAAYVRAEAPDGTLDFGDQLVKHPIIWRSFATFPPVTKFGILGTALNVDGFNPEGVVVGDLLKEIMDCCERRKASRLWTSEFADMMDDLERDLGYKRRRGSSSLTGLPIFPQSWTPANMFRVLRDYRDWFTVVRWEGLQVIPGEPQENTVFFFWDFMPQKLPSDYQEFNRRRMY